MFIEWVNDMKKQNMAVGLADLTNFAKLVDAVGSEKAIEFLLYSLAFLLINLFYSNYFF
jgi:hypothetical protein